MTRGPAVRVGNDVVDLRDRRCLGRASDERFLDRILSARERSVLSRAGDPDVLLWIVWAGKETGYKVVSKLLGTPPPFHHARFEVHLEAGSPSLPGPVRGRVRYEDLTVRFEATVAGEGYVHAVGWGGRGGGAPREGEPVGSDPGTTTRILEVPPLPEGREDWRSTMSDRFTGREWETIHNRSSALVRLEARTLASAALGVAEGEIEIVCPRGVAGRSPPILLVEGVEAGVDVSLSHHGRWVAAVLGPVES